MRVSRCIGQKSRKKSSTAVYKYGPPRDPDAHRGSPLVERSLRRLSTWETHLASNTSEKVLDDSDSSKPTPCPRQLAKHPGCEPEPRSMSNSMTRLSLRWTSSAPIEASRA